jgi:deazaflavin-dependent oxidoreductase (nitroreductase family)
MKMNPILAQFVRAISAMHAGTYRLTGGIGPLNRHTLILTTRGRKSGRERQTPLLYVQDRERLYIVASFGGNDSPPGWYMNLLANPEVGAQIGWTRKNYRARSLPADEAKPIWPRLLEMYPSYAEYQKKTTRQIPIVELSPV